jgi:hypothetical protein
MKLNLELVPSSCFYKNVRQILSKEQWSTISKQVRSSVYDACEICQSDSEQFLDCHEVWEYNDKKLIQKLIKMQALCKKCHGVKHFGLSKIQGKEAQAIRHLMAINKMTITQAKDYVAQAFQVWAERSKKTWKLDLSHLEEYGIDVGKLKRRST